MHACNGLDSDVTDWGNWFAQNGYIALAVDSFSSASRATECAARTACLRRRARSMRTGPRLPAYVPDVDGAHVGVIGFSHGGGTVLRTENADIAARAGFTGSGFAAAVALYPSECDKDPTSALIAPLLLLIGASDDWTDAKSL